MKALVENDSDRILGFAAFGVGGGETMAVCADCNDCRLAVHGSARCCADAPDAGGGIGALFSSEPAAQNQRTRAAK